MRTYRKLIFQNLHRNFSSVRFDNSTGKYEFFGEAALRFHFEVGGSQSFFYQFHLEIFPFFLVFNAVVIKEVKGHQAFGIRAEFLQ